MSRALRAPVVAALGRRAPRRGRRLQWVLLGDPRGRAPVRSFPAGATPDGVYDLAGNVFEWVLDWYGPYGPEPATDPTGPEAGVPPNVGRRVLRGGGFVTDTTYLAGFSRTGWSEVNDANEVDEMVYIGFRVVWPGDVEPDSLSMPR